MQPSLGLHFPSMRKSRKRTTFYLVIRSIRKLTLELNERAVPGKVSYFIVLYIWRQRSSFESVVFTVVSITLSGVLSGLKTEAEVLTGILANQLAKTVSSTYASVWAHFIQTGPYRSLH